MDPPRQDEPHQPSPTLWPVGFAVGIAVVLVGLIVNPVWISSIGGLIVVVFGVLWARAATAELRGHAVPVEPEEGERREAGVGDAPAVPANVGEAAMPPPAPGERFPRNRFLEASTLGLGLLIGGIVTVPIAGFAVLPAFLGQKRHKVDLGPVTAFPEGQWFIATFATDPADAEVSRRTAFIRNNGIYKNEPSFTIISKASEVSLTPTLPAGGFGCPCHGGQYDTEGNRTAGPPVRALDRWSFEINHGRLVLLSMYSVAKVDGTGAQAHIHWYGEAGPGEHLDGPEQWFYPLQPPHH